MYCDRWQAGSNVDPKLVLGDEMDMTRFSSLLRVSNSVGPMYDVASWWLFNVLVPFQLVQKGKTDRTGFNSLLIMCHVSVSVPG